MLLLLIACVGLFYLPITLPYNFSSMAKVYPNQQWKLLQDADGTLISTLHDFQTELFQKSTSYQFNGGDIVSKELTIDAQANKWVEAGDTVMAIHSSIIEEDINRLESELLVQKAALKVEQTGQKVSVVQESSNQVALAQRELALHKKNFDIAQQLYEEQIMPFVEYNAAKSTYELAKIQVETARNAVTTVETGEKSEQVNFIKSQITNLQQQLKFLKSKRNTYVIQTPIGGKISAATLPEEIVVIENVDEYMLKIPVKVQHQAYVTDSSRIEIQHPGSKETLTARLLEIGNKVMVINGIQVFFVKALVPTNASKYIGVGLNVKATIHTKDVTPLEFMQRTFEFNQ